MYPFDSQVSQHVLEETSNRKHHSMQVCSVILKVRNLETSVVTLLPKTIVMESDTVLTQYVIRNWYGVSTT